MERNLNLKMSRAAYEFFRNDDVPIKLRAELLRKCYALRDNPVPEESTLNIIEGEKIYRLVEPGARICYMIEGKTVAILVVLIGMTG